MFIFKKSSKRLRRMVSVVLCVIFSSYLFVLPAFAADPSGMLRTFVQVYGGGDGVTLTFDYPFSGSASQNRITSLNSNSTVACDPYSFNFLTSAPVNGSLGVYVSYYLTVATDNPDLVITPPSDSYWNSFYISAVNDDYVYTNYPNSVQISHFSVSPESGYVTTSGYALKGRVSDFDSIIDMNSIRITTDSAQRFTFGEGSGTVYLVVPSASYVVGLSSGELSELEGIADSITAQSEVLNAMYGDIMSVLNDMYTRLGSIEAAANLANTYFSQMIPLLQSINTNTVNIYSLLQTQFQLLRTLIATESGNIQDSIEQQTDDLIAYFDTVFSDAVGSMPEKSDDLQSSVDDYDSAESQYQSNAASRFDELASTFTGFSGGTLAGVTLASTLFSRVWSALGPYNIVYFYPLILGLCLVVIGRLGKSSGGQSSSEKHRGDSSA